MSATYPVSQNELAMPMSDADPTPWDQQYDERNLLMHSTNGLGYSNEHDLCKSHWKRYLGFFRLTIFLTCRSASFNLDQPILFRIGLLLCSDDYLTYLLGPGSRSDMGPSNPRLGVKIYIWIGVIEAQVAYG